LSYGGGYYAPPNLPYVTVGPNGNFNSNSVQNDGSGVPTSNGLSRTGGLLEAINYMASIAANSTSPFPLKIKVIGNVNIPPGYSYKLSTIFKKQIIIEGTGIQWQTFGGSSDYNTGGTITIGLGQLGSSLAEITSPVTNLQSGWCNGITLKDINIAQFCQFRFNNIVGIPDRVTWLLSCGAFPPTPMLELAYSSVGGPPPQTLSWGDVQFNISPSQAITKTGVTFVKETLDHFISNGSIQFFLNIGVYPPTTLVSLLDISGGQTAYIKNLSMEDPNSGTINNIICCDASLLNASIHCANATSNFKSSQSSASNLAMFKVGSGQLICDVYDSASAVPFVIDAAFSTSHFPRVLTYLKNSLPIGAVANFLDTNNQITPDGTTSTLPATGTSMLVAPEDVYLIITANASGTTTYQIDGQATISIAASATAFVQVKAGHTITINYGTAPTAVAIF
jgi:hypothetical protein